MKPFVWTLLVLAVRPFTLVLEKGTLPTCEHVTKALPQFECTSSENAANFSWKTFKAIQVKATGEQVTLWIRQVNDAETFKHVLESVRIISEMKDDHFLEVREILHDDKNFWIAFTSGTAPVFGLLRLLNRIDSQVKPRIEVAKQVAEAIILLHQRKIVWAAPAHNTVLVNSPSNDQISVKVFSLDNFYMVDQPLRAHHSFVELEPTFYSPDNLRNIHFGVDAFYFGIFLVKLFWDTSTFPFSFTGLNDYTTTIFDGSFELPSDLPADVALVAHLLLLRSMKRRLTPSQALQFLETILREGADLKPLGRKTTLSINKEPPEAVLQKVTPSIKKMYEDLHLNFDDYKPGVKADASESNEESYADTPEGKIVIFSVTVGMLVVVFGLVLLFGCRHRKLAIEEHQRMLAQLQPPHSDSSLAEVTLQPQDTDG